MTLMKTMNKWVKGNGFPFRLKPEQGWSSGREAADPFLTCQEQINVAGWHLDRLGCP